MSLGLEREIVDQTTYDQNVETLRGMGIILPRIGYLADPVQQPGETIENLSSISPDAPDPGNLFRIHWFNNEHRKELVEIPEHIVLGTELTGVEAKIIVLFGNRFPMIRAHKLLAAYGCLVPKLLSGKFNVAEQCAVWPSTGNYCRGGIALSRILGCRGIAVLPEGMSDERFRWLENWSTDPSDIIRTPGTESNVKEIYDVCHKLSQDPNNVILNQFSEFGNYVIHRAVTGPALEHVFNFISESTPLHARAYVSASGSGGTLAAGDYLKERLDVDICVVEAIECPTLLYNGYGDHNIQGIGDKHVPFIHNVLNMDFVIGVSDRASDGLSLLFNTTVGRKYLAERTGMDQQRIASLGDLGYSAIANILGAVKYAKYMNLGPNDAVLTVATDGAELYATELGVLEKQFAGNKFDKLNAAEVFGRYLLGVTTDHMIELDRIGRERIFNLGYFTWVEQQSVSIEDFDSRRDPKYWDRLMEMVPIWDDMISTFNAS
ncbi:MAG: pyridoxal-5'-phosphate-dependent protein subunit beta [Magnetovibrio sp.]|nr:pyridoxal-5'-phosphate-dependent protein subunit beta [Magnetovibrio sp.]